MNYLVIKCGGSVLESLPTSFYQDLIKLTDENQVTPIIVHGAGPMITEMLEKLHIETTFIDGLRVTDGTVLAISEMVLSGHINKQIVKKIDQHGGKALGISGVDGGLLLAKQTTNKAQGFVGEVTKVKTALLKRLCELGQVPIISPISTSEHGQTLNVNADAAAAAIATALKAPIVMVTNVDGVKQEGKVLHEITMAKARELIHDGTIYGGMIPKVFASINALEKGVPSVMIVNGKKDNCLSKLLSNEPIGTTFTKGCVHNRNDDQSIYYADI